MDGSPTQDADPSGQSPQLLIFDGDCGFCTTSARFAEERLSLTTSAWQFLDLDDLGLTVEDVSSAAWFIRADGAKTSGAMAVGWALRETIAFPRSFWHLIGRTITLPVIQPAAEAAYQLVARNRYRLPGATAACALPDQR